MYSAMKIFHDVEKNDDNRDKAVAGIKQKRQEKLECAQKTGTGAAGLRVAGPYFF